MFNTAKVGPATCAANAKPTLITSTDLHQLERSRETWIRTLILQMSHLRLFVSANETEANIVYNRCGLTKLPPSGNMRFYILVEKKRKLTQMGTALKRPPTQRWDRQMEMYENSSSHKQSLETVQIHASSVFCVSHKVSKHTRVQKHGCAEIHRSMFVDFPNIVRLHKLHFATNTSFVLANKTH